MTHDLGVLHYMFTFEKCILITMTVQRTAQKLPFLTRLTHSKSFRTFFMTPFVSSDYFPSTSLSVD